MRVLFVTDSYKPAPSPNAICVERLKGELESQNITCDVISLRTFSKDLEYAEDSTVSFIEPDFIYDSIYAALHYDDKKKLNRYLKLSRLRGALYGVFWPFMSITHLCRYTRAIGDYLYKYENEQVVVIGVYKSLEAALSGVFAKKKYRKGTYFLYTLDAVAGSIIPKIYGSSTVSNKAILRWERFMFKTYDCIFMMNSHRDYYSDKRYDDVRNKFEFVDIPLVVHNPYKYEKREKIHFVFTGGLSQDTADPRYFLKLLDNISNDKIVFDIYGKIHAEDIRCAINESKYVDYHGVVSHEEILKIQASADVLVNFGNNTPCAIPCKIFEYFSTGRPVVSLIKSDNDSSLEYVKKYPLSCIADERESIEKNIISIGRIICQAASLKKLPSVKDVFKYNTPVYTVEQIKQRLNSLCIVGDR